MAQYFLVRTSNGVELWRGEVVTQAQLLDVKLSINDLSTRIGEMSVDNTEIRQTILGHQERLENEVKNIEKNSAMTNLVISEYEGELELARNQIIECRIKFEAQYALLKTRIELLEQRHIDAISSPTVADSTNRLDRLERSMIDRVSQDNFRSAIQEVYKRQSEMNAALIELKFRLDRLDPSASPVIDLPKKTLRRSNSGVHFGNS